MMETLDARQKIIIIPLMVSAVLVTVGIIIGDIPILGNLIIISVFVSVVPYFLLKYSQLLWLKGVEDQFPNFVRDLADSSRSGMSLTECIGIAAKANYGKLSPEIQKMHNRLTWGTPFLRVVELFQEGVKGSRIIGEALSIIRQSYETGGSIPATLDSVSKDIIMLKEAEAERVSLVREQVMIMYGLFFIFLGISIMIIYVMVPMLHSQVTATKGIGGFTFSNPCEGGLVFPCGLFTMICAVLDINPGITCYYVAIFFSIVLVQGFFTGLIAGQLGENSPVSGVKHSLIMSFAAVGIFLFLAKIGWFPA